MKAAYETVKQWRAKNPDYGRKWMQERRRYFKQMWKEGRIAYEDIPKSYRCWTNSET